VNRMWPVDRMHQTSVPLPAFPDNSQAHGDRAIGLSLTVLFTTVAATLRALQRGGDLAKELGAGIRILVPHIVPYPVPLDRPQVDPEFKIRRFRTLSVDGSVQTRIDVLLCRDPSEAVTQSLGSQSVVLIGGRTRWWPTREKRLAKSLTLAGHHVIWVPEDSDSRRNQ
jgi:hypothetical protein